MKPTVTMNLNRYEELLDIESKFSNRKHTLVFENIGLGRYLILETDDDAVKIDAELFKQEYDELNNQIRELKSEIQVYRHKLRNVCNMSLWDLIKYRFKQAK